jgi:hypothetical protein
LLNNLLLLSSKQLDGEISWPNFSWKQSEITHFRVLIRKIKKNTKKLQLFFLVMYGHRKWNYPKSKFLIFFKFGKLVEHYLMLLPSKPLDWDFLLFRKYWILNTVTSEIFSVFWKYLGQFFLENKVKKRILKVKNTKKLHQQFLRLFFLLRLIWCGITP